MIYLRFEADNEARFGVLEGEAVREVKGFWEDGLDFTGKAFPLREVRLLAPCEPSKIVAVGLNYMDHIKEFGDREVPVNPTVFIKLPHTVIGQGETIVLPRCSERVDYEAELAVVIKKECRGVAPENVEGYLLGATCLNDVTARDLQKLDGQWTRAKNFETFCPMGPWIVDGLDYRSLDISGRLNGEARQSSNTRFLLFDVGKLVSFISEIMPLYPGDVVSTGTPFGVGPMKDGDVVEVEIGGIGVLSNRVRRDVHPV